MPDALMPSMPSPPAFRFVVLYRWKVDPSKEEQFCSAGEVLTREIRVHGGGLGSRLHKASDGTWWAYAQWPDKETWEKSSVTTKKAQQGIELMSDAVDERLPHIELSLVTDLLVPVSTK